jgi:cyanuric acid amidohydrolase
MALGVALGLGEITQETFDTTRIAGDLDVYSAVASTSAGGELISCEILLFGNSSQATSACRMGHAILKDAIDASGVRRALASAGLQLSAEPTDAEASRIAAIFAKAEASPTGKIRGHRNTMLSDADINYERHARAALGAVIASVTSDTAIFVSGGTEHQCAPGEAPIAAIVRI